MKASLAALPRSALRVLATALPVVLLAARPAFAQLEPSEVELEDVIDIELLGRDVIAYDLLSTGRSLVRLEIGEEPRWSRASGRVAIVVTDRRVMAASPGSEGWREVRWGVHEISPERALLGKRVALAVTSRRILGFDGRTGTWVGQDIGPNEEVVEAEIGDGTAVVVTNRQAYGLSPDAGGFFTTRLAIHEHLQSVRVSANMGTVRTSKRVLVFRAPVGSWTVERRPLH